MNERIALLFPGQGSQQVGMGRALFEHPLGREVFVAADAALGFALSKLCIEGPQDQLQLTANAQPAILTCSIAALQVLRHEVAIAPIVAMGHSLGEFSALVAADAISFVDAVQLVRLRGLAMQDAVPPGRGAMAAILGVAADELETLCRDLAGNETLSPANENGGGQIVVAGDAVAVERLVEAVKARKGRAIPLKVSAPFHCALMAPAAEKLRGALESVHVASPRIPVISNVDATAHGDAHDVKSRLVRQVTERVRWEACVMKAVELGATRALEVGHGQVLAGLVKRITTSLPVVSLGSPADIDVLKVGA